MASRRAVPAEGFANARDLGGLPLVGGGTTPTGVFIRSESPDRLTASGWATLREAGVRSVLDLRQPVERDRDTGSRPMWLTSEHVDHDGLSDEPGFWEAYWDTGLVGTPLYYLPHLERLPERTVAALDALARAPRGAVLFHCAGGRDRTGLVAAILLVIARVEREAIVADYLETITNAETLASGQGRPNGEPEVAALLEGLGTDSEQAFRAFLDGLDVEPLLALMPVDRSTAIRTWRGTLRGRSSR